MTADRSPRRLVRFVGLARSGNHAIINWVLRQLPGRWAFLNCVQCKTDPFRSARPMDDGRRALSNVPEFDLEAAAAGRRPPLDHLLLSMEDTFLKPGFGPAADAALEAAGAVAPDRLDVIVLRDPYNLFASRRGLEGFVLEPATALRVWRQHARAHLGERAYRFHPTVCISFNRWAADRDYRREVAARLDLPFTDAGREEVPPCGGGSSFDGARMHGRASRMAVNERWRRFRDEPGYAALFDEQTRALAERLFPDIPAGEIRSLAA